MKPTRRVTPASIPSNGIGSGMWNPNGVSNESIASASAREAKTANLGMSIDPDMSAFDSLALTASTGSAQWKRREPGRFSRMAWFRIFTSRAPGVGLGARAYRRLVELLEVHREQLLDFVHVLEHRL